MAHLKVLLAITTRQMVGPEKIRIGKLHWQEIPLPVRETRRLTQNVGNSHMIREVSHVCIYDQQ